MQQEFTYWPYEEVQMYYEDEKDSVVVQAPWIQLKLESKHYEKDALDYLVTSFAKKTLNPQNDLELVNSFFSDFSEYPLCYILPTEKEYEDLHEIADEFLLEGSLEGLLRILLEQMEVEDVDANLKSCLSVLSRKEFEWDVEEALSFSQSTEGIHPESFLTVARRMHNWESAHDSRTEELLIALETLPKKQAKRALSLLVKQTAHIQENSKTALIAANYIAGMAQEELISFINQESVHPEILDCALNALSNKPSNLEITPPTQSLIAILEFIASRNFLAFTFAIDALARRSEEELEQVVDQLRFLGNEQDARLIDQHLQTNDSQAKESSPLMFLDPMRPVSSQYAKEALKLAELVTLLMNSIAPSTIEVFKKSL